MTDPALIEAMARALRSAIKEGEPGDWNTLHPRSKEAWTDLAASVLSALASAGMAVVKVEPSEAMLEAGGNVRPEGSQAYFAGLIYRARLNAATGATPTVVPVDLELARRRLGELNECAPISDCPDCEQGLTTSCLRRAEAVLGEN